MTTKKRTKGPQKHLSKRLAKSIGHDVRIDVLRILNERVASPKELARAMEEGLSHISFHIKVLRDYGCIELVKTEPRRGAVEHYYRAVTWPFVSDEEARKLPRATREKVSITVLQAIVGEAAGALQAGTFDSRPDRHVSWAPMRLDEEGWREMMALQAETLERTEEIKTRNAKRLSGSGEAGMSVIVAMMGFERSECPAAGP